MYLTQKVNWGHYFCVSSLGQDRHFMQSSKPCADLTVCRTKTVPSFLSYFKTVSVGPGPEIEPLTSHSAVKCYTTWTNPATIPDYFFIICLKNNANNGLPKIVEITSWRWSASTRWTWWWIASRLASVLSLLLLLFWQVNVGKSVNNFFPTLLKRGHSMGSIACHASVFRGAHFSSLPTNTCSTEDNIPFPLFYLRGNWPINSRAIKCWQAKCN